MKPELLLFLKLYADQYSLLFSVHQATVPLFLQQRGVPEQNHQQLLIKELDQVHKNANNFLRVFLEFLEKYYPSTFVSESGKRETIDELIKKISLLGSDSTLN